ncbi:hypothetical protein IMF27_14715 [Pseudomonas sp. PCH199]|nr:hypothetical protein [Pseudomonas sp. PCH199]MCW8276771.1 hypothetical protein [Pseudomonas sp. PCH199]PAM83053.1 hypothetical protein CES87_15020 [Pseudomonas sp. ERMR1:02]
MRELLLDPSQDRGLFNPAMLDRLLTDPQGQLIPLRGSKLWQLAALNSPANAALRCTLPVVPGHPTHCQPVGSK